MHILFNFAKSIWSKKIFRFACVGVINTLVDITILNNLVFIFGLPLVIANFISASTSITLSYFLNHHIVFREKQSHSIIKFLKFFFVTGISILVIQTLIIVLVTHLLGSNKTIIYNGIISLGLKGFSTKFINLNSAKIAAVIAGMGWNFIFYQKIVFKHINLEDDQVPFSDDQERLLVL